MKKIIERHAEFTTYGYETIGWSCETTVSTSSSIVKNEQEAVEICRKSTADSFRTYQITIFVDNGKKHRGPKEYFSKPRYVTDRLLSKQDVLAAIPKNERSYAGNERYVKAPENALYISTWNGDFVEMKGAVKAYNRETGELLWPKEPVAPKKRPRATAKAASSPK